MQLFVELGIVKAEFTGGSGHTETFGQLKGFFTKFRRVLFA